MPHVWFVQCLCMSVANMKWWDKRSGSQKPLKDSFDKIIIKSFLLIYDFLKKIILFCFYFQLDKLTLTYIVFSTFCSLLSSYFSRFT